MTMATKAGPVLLNTFYSLVQLDRQLNLFYHPPKKVIFCLSCSCNKSFLFPFFYFVYPGEEGFALLDKLISAPC